MSGTIGAIGTTTIGYTGQIVTETVAAIGYYDITDIGAAGGATTGSGAESGGSGAEIGGTVLLTQGETIEIAVGGKGQSASGTEAPGGGGGGSFIVGPNTTPIIIAGGGGGAQYTEPGSNALGIGGTGNGGSGGGSGEVTPGGGGGGGLSSNGTAGENAFLGGDPLLPESGGGGGGSFVSGAAGGSTPYSSSGGAGGFGGGGGAGDGNGGGGGGGYSGGNGGNFNTGVGGGGTSYNSGANQVTTLGVGTGNGSVTFAMHSAPTIAGVVPAETAYSSATLTPFSTVQIGAETATLSVTATVTLSSTTNGTLGNLGAGTLSGSTYTVVGTAAQDTAAIDALTFTPAAMPGSTFATTFTFNANDGVENAATMPTTTLTDMQVPVPIFAGTGNQIVAPTDETSVTAFSGVLIADPNVGQTETAVVSVGTAANGMLSDPNSAVDGSSTSNSTITFTGSATAVANDLDKVVFTPTAHQVAPGTVVSTTITAAIRDTAGEQTSFTSAVSATAVNDAPVITVGSAAAGQAMQDTAAIKPFTTASVGDVDTGVQDSLTIVLSNAANGTLSGTGLAASSTPGTYTLAAAAPANLTSELQALTFTPTAHEAAAGTTVTTTFALTASQTAGGSTVTSTTNSTTSVIATETSSYNVINGPANGHAKIYCTSGNDQITAFGTQNQIYGEGGNDLINAGAGQAIVSLGNGNSTVTLGGSTNAVVGGNGNMTVTGGPGGYNGVALGNGNDTVTVGGTHDIIVLGTGTDMVSGPQGMSFITTGGGNDTIVLGGSGNTVSAGGGNNTISGGTGSNTFILPGAGQGFDAIAGFTEGNSDVLNLHAALQETNWNGKANTLANYVKVTDVGSSTDISIANGGTGGGVLVAQLTSTPKLGFADLVSHHSFAT